MVHVYNALLNNLLGWDSSSLYLLCIIVMYISLAVSPQGISMSSSAFPQLFNPRWMFSAVFTTIPNPLSSVARTEQEC